MGEGRLAVLVVGDEIADLISDYLLSRGHAARVLRAFAPGAILEELSADLPDVLIVANNGLSPGNVAEALREVRASHPSIRLLALSGYFNAALEKAWREAGADACLEMPFRFEALEALLVPSGG